LNYSTPIQAFLHWEKNTPKNLFLRQPVDGEWREFNYQEAGKEMRSIAAALKKQFPPKTNIAILSKNCAHWILCDLAIMFSGNISVPIYPTLSAEGVRQILEHSEAKAVFIGKLDNFKDQRNAIGQEMVKISFPWYGINEGTLWRDLVIENNGDNLQEVPQPDEIASIMYSSGTTGTPKGVMLSHGAFGFVGNVVTKHFNIVSPERFFSYLPLSHIAERALMEMVALASGSKISFTESLDKFQDNLVNESPTMFGGVPRIYAKFQEGVLKKFSPSTLNLLLAIPGIRRILGNAIQKKLGLSDARIIVSGAAPIPVVLLHWYKKLGINIMEVYGMTENTAFSHSNFRKIKIGSVGEPWPECESKLSDEGEILIRHPALMTGYYKDEETTAAVFTDDHFLRTGDKGFVDKEGFWFITGRIKDQFKTDKGKFIAPAPIELRLLGNLNIEQASVVGMGLPQPIGLVVLNSTGKQKSKEEIISDLASLLERVNAPLENYERLEKIVIMNEPWTIENGLLTPSLKIKRTELEKRFLSLYQDWYKHREKIIWQ
jgi:long-chain acyl-CoA synthetase